MSTFLNAKERQIFVGHLYHFKRKYRLQRKKLARIIGIGDSTIGMWFRFAVYPRRVMADQVRARMDEYEQDHRIVPIQTADNLHGIFPPHVREALERERILENEVRQNPTAYATFAMTILIAALQLVAIGIGLWLIFAPGKAHAASPFESIPDWGTMKAAEARRTYEEYAPNELIAPPAYDIKQLSSGNVLDLVQQRDHGDRRKKAAAIRALTAKLYYSTRYCAQYDLDGKEYAGEHCAIDLKAPLGSPIHAIKSGRVYRVGVKDKIFGNYVTVAVPWDGETVYVTYGHMDTVKVKKGRRVGEGQVLGTVGLTGMTSGAHLHLQVDRDDGAGNEYPYIYDEKPTQSEAAKHTINPVLLIER